MADMEYGGANESESRFLREALFLANSYTWMLKRKEDLEQRLAGSWKYTKDMAIEELDSITIAYGGERVQSSNISNPTERIAMKLTDEFMARKQRELDASREGCAEELNYLNWKIEVVETVWKERAKGFQKSVFQLLFYQHKTYREAGSILKKKKRESASNRKIAEARMQILELFILEVNLRSRRAEDADYVKRLITETEGEYGKEEQSHTDGKDQGSQADVEGLCRGQAED